MTSELASVKELREGVLEFAPNIRRKVCMALDEIEREVERGWIKLPVDADGVPIRIGDTVREVDDRVPMKVMSLTFYEDCVDVNTYGMNPNLLRHFKPRTIENVLEEFAHVGIRIAAKGGIAINDVNYYADKNAIAKYAAELRGMMEDES